VSGVAGDGGGGGGGGGFGGHNWVAKKRMLTVNTITWTTQYQPLQAGRESLLA
jgi:hypothetical protein